MTHRLIIGGELVLYGFVGDTFFEEGFTALEVRQALDELNGDITVRLNSGGGHAHEGIAIYTALKDWPGSVAVEIDAVAASAASVIAMAGDSITMHPAAFMMVHNAGGITLGTADDHREHAELLDTLSAEAGRIYVARTGLSAGRVEELMDAETWMTGEEALELGFATQVADAKQAPEMSVPAFFYTEYRNSPEMLMSLARERGWTAPEPKAAEAAADRQEEKTMPKKTTQGQAAGAATPGEPFAMGELAAAAAEQVRPAENAAEPATLNADAVRNEATLAERRRANEINRIVTLAKLDKAEADRMIESGLSADKAREQVFELLAKRDEPGPNENQSTVVVMHDQVDRFREGATKALMLKAGHEGERNEFSSYTMLELARASLSARNIRVTSGDKRTLAGYAFNPVMAGGMHSTSDFGNILQDVAHKSMLKGWEEAEETFEIWTSTGSVPDFKPNRRVDLNLFPNLALKEEGAEYEYGTIGDRGELVQVATYGRKFAITRETVINDDMSVLTRVPGRMGRAARRTIGDAVYNILTSNPNLSDGNPLFDAATHKNVKNPGAAPSTAEFDAARTAMMIHKDPDNIASSLNIRPRWVLVPPGLTGAASVVVESETEIKSGQNNSKVPNSVRNMVDVISDARLSGDDYFFIADPNMHDTIEVTYLDGESEPFMDQMDVWSVDGTEFKVRIDFGVSSLDYRGFYRNDGGA